MWVRILLHQRVRRGLSHLYILLDPVLRFDHSNSFSKANTCTVCPCLISIKEDLRGAIVMLATDVLVVRSGVKPTRVADVACFISFNS